MTANSEAEQPPTEMDLDRRASVRIGRERFRTDVAVRGHPIVVDEPVAVGGTDLGPTPFDLVCAALGSCTAITLRMYADRKEWPLEEVTAEVEHRRDQQAGGSADVFTMIIDLRGPLEESQVTRLMEIAGRCPVHRMLVAGATIETLRAVQG